MTRRKILSATEREEFDSPPSLTASERKRYFSITDSLASIVSKLRTPKNQVFFVVRLGYFKATGRFFSAKFRDLDIQYVARKLGFIPEVIDLDSYDDKATSNRHRKSILEFLGVRAFDEVAERELLKDIRSMIRSQLRPKFILLQAVERLQSRNIEIPSSHALTELIAMESKRHGRELTDLIDSELTPEQRSLLDDLLTKEDEADGDQSTQRYKLTLLKRFTLSTKPGKIKANVADMQILRDLHHKFEAVIDSLDLSQEGLRYYANAALKLRSFQLFRRSDDDRNLHLLCFIAHQFYRIQDTLIDAMLASVQNFRNGCKREHKDICYDERIEDRQSMKALVSTVEKGARNPLMEIESIVFSDELADAEKVCCIQEVLKEGEEERTLVDEKLTQFHEQSARTNNDADYFRLVEGKSVKLQNRVSEIIKEMDFNGEHGSPLLAAVTYYKEKDGAIGQSAPTAFLEPKERKLIFDDAGKIRVSLYKALLFVKAADAIKAGALNVRHSYKYRSLDDYLISKESWTQDRDDLLRRAELGDMADCARTLESLAAVLDSQFQHTNCRILNDENPHVHFRKDGTYFASTPKVDGDDEERLSGLFPESRYISLLEVLASVNRLTGFVDNFEHWQVTRNRSKPSDKTFFAGIIGYGCFIGTRKIAHISNPINESELENAIRWYFSLDNIHAANDGILKFLDDLDLPELFRNEPGVLHTSSDGQKYDMAVDSLNANYSFKYHGQEKGVTAYGFLDERQFMFYSTVFSSADKEAAYVIDGLMHNDVVKSDIHSTDTGGYSDAIFGVTHPLGFTYAPRLKNLKKRELFTFSRETRNAYEAQGFRVLPTGYIDLQLIREHWDDILRFVATIKLKETTASQLFRRLNSYSKHHPLWKAIKEYGKIIKTIFILRYLDDVEFRQAIEKQLNKGENSNKFSKAVSFGHNQEFLHGEKVEQEIAEGCRRLIKNAIICWNYVYLSQRIADESDPEKRRALIEAVRSGSVATWGHFNLHGEFDLSDEKLEDSVGLRVPKNLDLTTA